MGQPTSLRTPPPPQTFSPLRFSTVCFFETWDPPLCYSPIGQQGEGFLMDMGWSSFAWFQKGMQIYKSRSQIIVWIQICMIKPRSSQLIGAAWSQKYRDPSASQGNGRYQHFFAAFGFTSIGQTNVKLGCFPVPHFLWLWGPANNNRYVAEHYLSKQLR